MKISLVILASFCAVALCVPTVKDGDYMETDKGRLDNQKDILTLFYRVKQPKHEDVEKPLSLKEITNSCSKPEVVKDFEERWTNGMLPRNTIFSVMNEEHLEQAISLFNLFYYSVDLITFLDTAMWAQRHVNQGMFIYAFNLALVHRPDTGGIMLPPIYEVSPHLFFDSETITEAQRIKQKYDPQTDNGTCHIIKSNYSGSYLNLAREQTALSYYMEDIGLNSVYYYYHIYYPSWMTSQEFGWEDSRRGEIFYYLTQQILARFYAERISNGLGGIRLVEWNTPVVTPYEPSLTYPNGLAFPNRPKFANLHTSVYNYGQKWTDIIYGYSHSFVKDYERRIMDAIDMGFVFNEEGKMFRLDSEEGLDMLGNLIQGNGDSVNRKLYGDIMLFARHLLGYARQPLDITKLIPSALEHYETSMRDPVLYQLLKRILLKFERYIHHYLKPYTEKELAFPGVKVTNMEIDSLITFFDQFDSDLHNAVYYAKDEIPLICIKARQQRLNHKPFNVKININSERNSMAMVKIFMAPKYDEVGRRINLTENRRNMVELDTWIQELKSGENVITRNSNDFKWYVGDRKSMTKLYDEVDHALKKNQPLKVDGRQNYFYYPRRLMLPRGSKGGTTFRFVVVVSPTLVTEAKELDTRQFIAPGTSEIFLDNRPLLYPFDRPIKFERMWYNIPNIYVRDEKIYHKGEREINAPHHE